MFDRLATTSTELQLCGSILRGDLPAACAGEQVYTLEQVTFRSPFFVPALEQTVIFSTAAKMKIPMPCFWVSLRVSTGAWCINGPTPGPRE